MQQNNESEQHLGTGKEQTTRRPGRARIDFATAEINDCNAYSGLHTIILLALATGAARTQAACAAADFMQIAIVNAGVAEDCDERPECLKKVATKGMFAGYIPKLTL